MNERSAKPIRKVTASGLSGAIVTILVWAIEYFGHVDIPAPVVAALVTVVTFVTAYLVPPAADESGA